MRSEAKSPSPDPLALGVLLAGGRGERLGLGVPKAHAVLAGRTLFERALVALGGACRRVWVAAPAEMVLPATTSSAPRFTRVTDPPEAGGPLAGLAAVAAAAGFVRSGSERGIRIVTLAVDLPLVTSSTLRALLAAYDMFPDPGVDPGALVPAPGGHPQPLAAVWSRAAFDALAEAFSGGERSVVRACMTLGARLLDNATLTRMGIADEIARDVDTTADLAAVSRWLHDAARESA